MKHDDGRTTEEVDTRPVLRLLMVSYTSSDGGSGISLTIEDKASGLRVLDLDLSYEEAGKLFSNGHVEARLDGGFPKPGLPYGKRREVQTIFVHGLTRDHFKEGAAQTHTEMFVAETFPGLKDAGWRPEQNWSPKGYNNHKAKAGGYDVTFVRYVEPNKD